MTACKDCEPGSKRPAPHPGPRCVTHHRIITALRRQRSSEARRLAVYNLSPEDHARLVLIQGGACAICQRATGKTRALAVDHDHACCNGPVSCGRCVRGLLCKPCNRMLGHLRDDPAAAERAAAYLRNPPAAALSASASASSSAGSRGSSAAGAPGTGR